jgi:hypothetical protein
MLSESDCMFLLVTVPGMSWISNKVPAIVSRRSRGLWSISRRRHVLWSLPICWSSGLYAHRHSQNDCVETCRLIQLGWARCLRKFGNDHCGSRTLLIHHDCKPQINPRNDLKGYKRFALWDLQGCAAYRSVEWSCLCTVWHYRAAKLCKLPEYETMGEFWQATTYIGDKKAVSPPPISVNINNKSKTLVSSEIGYQWDYITAVMNNIFYFGNKIITNLLYVYESDVKGQSWSIRDDSWHAPLVCWA